MTNFKRSYLTFIILTLLAEEYVWIRKPPRLSNRERPDSMS